MAKPSSRLRIDFPPELPISSRAEEITAAIQNNSVVILAGETGSGKTTQIPKLCLAAGCGNSGRIACTQPRRVAALSISRRVAEEMGVEWGREVGCKVRFADQTSNATVIKFLTDGMLLAELQGDPMLREYDTIIIDEAHERSLNIDFLLGHLRTLRYRRPELKIVVTSATIDTEAFSKAFDDAPVIEVSGRMYPVEVIYAPLDALGSDAAADDEPVSRAEALHYVDGAVEAVERIVHESSSGDILVFMPSERDIREMRDVIDGRRIPNTDVVPLFGRLSNSEQQRVFSPTQRRKIVIATNIAETSLTIPGIRFVVDTGLARLSRYAPQSRTRRLPIEPVSQSSADQRKGRCGRVSDGVCIRLFSEKDYLDRHRFTQPEIQRANLADVILRMRVSGLGDIERFPFLNAPPMKAIRSGYQLLEELGAIEMAERPAQPAASSPATASGPATAEPASDTTIIPDRRLLTNIGRELARMPVDPTVGRMILQARAERCLREVVIIAAGLSIQDPRERPLDKQAQADTAQRRFAHPDSDFLTLLNIWETFHDEFETMTQGKLRRFCHDHFLSYTRMREWRDIHDQLVDILGERDDFKATSVYDGATDDKKKRAKEPHNPCTELPFGTPGYRAIHRSILSGLLGNIAMLDEESGLYKAAHDRKATLFPGSVLHAKDKQKPKQPHGSQSPRANSAPKRSPRWIMAAEIVETSRLYARTVARLDPLWALDLGEHLIKVSHSEPFWNPDAGRVMVKRRARLHGLELETRSVGYGRINPVNATEIFIREALVNDTITRPLDFLLHNRKVRDKVETILTRTRSSGYLNIDEALYRFYASHLVPETAADTEIVPVSCVAELTDLVREKRITNPRFLFVEPENLRGTEEATHDAADFPDAIPLENRVLELDYNYRPGAEEDGVTLRVPVREADNLTEARIDWAVPGHLEDKVLHYLKALPTEQRRTLIPLAETAKAVADAVARMGRLRDHQDTLEQTLIAHLREAHRIAVDPRVWKERPLPDHLRVRLLVEDENGKPLVSSRAIDEIRAALDAHSRKLSVKIASTEPAPWQKARAQWEKPPQTAWAFGDIPASVPVCEQAGVPVLAYPALVPGADGVVLKLQRSPEEARDLTRHGLTRLIELQLRYELAWLERDLRSLREVGVLAADLVPFAQLQEHAFNSLRRWLCNRPVAPLTAARFAAVLEQVKIDLRGIVPKLSDLLREILELRRTLIPLKQPYNGLARDLAALLPPDFLDATPYPQLGHLPRYLKGMKIRAERWKQNPARDAERAVLLEPYLKSASSAATVARAGGPAASSAERFRWLVEEYRVSLFAQELGTAERVSPEKLDQALSDWRNGLPATAPQPASGVLPKAPADVPAKESKPAPPPAPPASKSATLKSLGALDTIFRKG